MRMAIDGQVTDPSHVELSSTVIVYWVAQSDQYSNIGSLRQPHATVLHAAVDLVVLTDYLVADPRMVRDLHSQGVPHLPVRVRDGTGLVGPLVIPGVTSCLVCH
jgi:hypothetical protein